MTEEKQIIDGGEVKVIRAEPMSLERKVADIVDQTEQGLALFEERVRVAKKQLGIALRLASPGQIMSYGEGNKQTIYLTGGAADRILRVGFGLRWSDKQVVVSKDSDGVTATATADLLRPDGTVYESFSGSRRMVYDSESKGGIKGYIKNEPDLIKSALQNLKHTAVTDLLGVRFLSPADLLELGIDLSKLPRQVEFQDHGEDDNTSPTVPFGKNKGKPITELGEKSLDWYISAAESNVVDPSKAKWKDKEQRWLDSLKAEKARRANQPPTEQPDQKDAFDYGPPPISDKEAAELEGEGVLR